LKKDQSKEQEPAAPAPGTETSKQETNTEAKPSTEQLKEEPLQPQTENMEVHKHPHHVTHKKKWGEYLLEFFMLFLAVFLGFVAENIRENIGNREIEKKNMESFVKNLQEDSLDLVQSIDVNEKRYQYLDSLFYLKNSNVADDVFQKQFIYYMLKLGYLDYFISNQSTFEQMQSSGTLRLIRHPDVLDSILKYETGYKQIRHQEDICSTWWNKSIEQVSAIIDLTSLAQLPGNKLWYITQFDLAGIRLPKISKDMPALQPYYNWRVNERISLGYYIQDLEGQLSYARALIPFLKKEYHLKND
jgi:hypothetical protein